VGRRTPAKRGRAIHPLKKKLIEVSLL